MLHFCVKGIPLDYIKELGHDLRNQYLEKTFIYAVIRLPTHRKNRPHTQNAPLGEIHNIIKLQILQLH